MPWTEPLANADDLRRCVRDLVALSTLPAAWRNYDTRQIGDSIVATLIAMLAADFVLIMLPSHGNRITELVRSDPKLNPGSLDDVRAMLQSERATISAERAGRRCRACRGLLSQYVSDQNREAVADDRRKSGGNCLPAVVGRRR